MPSPKQKPSPKAKAYAIVGQPSQAALPQHVWDLLQTVGADITTLKPDELADLEAQGVIRPVKIVDELHRHKKNDTDAEKPST